VCRIGRSNRGSQFFNLDSAEKPGSSPNSGALLATPGCEVKDNLVSIGEKPREPTRIARGLALEPKVHYLAFGELASQLRLVHGFEFEFEDDWLSC